MTVWHHPKGNVHRPSGIRRSAGNRRRKRLNLPWPQRQSCEREGLMSLLSPLDSAQITAQNTFSTSTLLSHSCSRARSRRWLPPICDVTTIQWVTIMKLTWVKRLRGIVIVSRHARPAAGSAFWASFNTVYSWKLTRSRDVCGRPPSTTATE